MEREEAGGLKEGDSMKGEKGEEATRRREGGRCSPSHCRSLSEYASSAVSHVFWTKV
ncbi:hypothetical protein B0G52_1272 [Cohnella sp. SGD-V74]|nr:hypothetical protein B0G52_1272 [Cohnella sp. SGD-V74]